MVITNAQLRHAFKHARDFGIEGDANKQTLAKFAAKIEAHIAASGTERNARWWTMNHADYQELLYRYLDGAMSSSEFQILYLEKFKKEHRRLPDDVFDVLDALFADVDAFCPDTGLLAELNRANQDDYLNEQVLRHRVSAASERLKKILIGQAQARVV